MSEEGILVDDPTLDDDLELDDFGDEPLLDFSPDDMPIEDDWNDLEGDLPSFIPRRRRGHQRDFNDDDWD